MMRLPALLGIGAIISLGMPQSADALTFVQVLSLFHVATGLLLTFVMLIFCTGVFVYYARLGTWPSHRDYAIKILEWSVALLSILIILLALLRFFQIYTHTALVILAVIILLVVAIFIVRGAAEAKKKPPARPGVRPPGK